MAFFKKSKMQSQQSAQSYFVRGVDLAREFRNDCLERGPINGLETG
jgi:hypothetical protein